MNTQNNSRKVTMEDLARSMTDLTAEMREGFAGQDKKITQLTVEMHEGFEEQDKKTDQKIAALAVEMREGFKKQDEKMDLMRESVSNDIETLAQMTKRGFDKLDEQFITRKWLRNIL